MGEVKDQRARYVWMPEVLQDPQFALVSPSRRHATFQMWGVASFDSKLGSSRPQTLDPRGLKFGNPNLLTPEAGRADPPTQTNEKEKTLLSLHFHVIKASAQSECSFSAAASSSLL